MTAVYAALLGSLAGGFGHYLLARRTARVDRTAMLTALVAEVAVLRDLLRAQFDGAAGADAADPGPIAVFPIVYHGSLAAVYDGLSAKLGDLDAESADAIVRFHTLYKIVVGATEQRGTAAIDRRLVEEIVRLAERIEALRGEPRRS